MVEKVVKKKLVNFLVQDVALNHNATRGLLAGAGSGSAASVSLAVEISKRFHGGTWIGGSMVLTDSVVRLSANAMNRFIQEGTMDIELPLSIIRTVVVEPGILTKIVRMDTEVGVIKFRCFGAKDVAALIQRMIPAQ